MEMEVSGCLDCVFCTSSHDSTCGINAWTHTCNIAHRLGFEEILTEKDRSGMPLTPIWCPLKIMKQINIIWK